jgi:nitrite reductase (NADH) small subunit
MKIESFEACDFNMMKLNEIKYFIINENKQTRFVSTKCPHRGGPLHYGHLEDNNKKVVCPWHDNIFQLCRLEAKVPLHITVMGKLKVIFNDEDQVTFWKEALPITRKNYASV